MYAFFFQEFFSPIMYVMILAAIRMSTPDNTFAQFGDFPEYSLNASLFSATPKSRILVTPDNTYTRALMTGIEAEFQTLANKTLTSEFFMNRTEAENEYLRNSSRVFAGIIFDFKTGNNLSYAIRYPIGDLPADYASLFTSQASCRRKEGDNQVNYNGLQNDGSCRVNSFIFSGFTQLQMAIDKALVENQYGLTFDLQEVKVQMLPKSAFKGSFSYIQIISSMYYVLAFIPLVAFFVSALVTEKQKKIKEGMKMMGLKNSVFWYVLVFLVS